MASQYSFKEKLDNWWWYHKNHCFIALVFAVMIGYMVWSSHTAILPDYDVALISATKISEQKRIEIENALKPYAEDINKDGVTSVMVHVYHVDMAYSEDEGGSLDYMDISAMDADLIANISGIFLLDNPKAFQYQTRILCYTDGTTPEEDAPDVENMVIPWADIPGLNQVDAGGLYLGLHLDSHSSESAENFDDYFGMWNRILDTMNP